MDAADIIQIEVRTTVYERIIKTAKHTLIFGIGGLANSAYGFLLLPLYVRHINSKEYGVLSLMMLALSLLVILLRLGLNQAFFRGYYETDDALQRRRMAGSLLLFMPLFSGAVIGLLFPAASWLSSALLAGDISRTPLMKLMLATCFFEAITTPPELMLRANFKSLRYSILNIVALAFQLGAISYVVLGLKEQNAYGVMAGRLAGTIFEAALFYWAIRSELAFTFSAHEIRSMLGFGSPLVLSQLLTTLFVMCDRLFVERYGNEAEVGVYAMAGSVVLAISVLVTVPFNQVWSVMRFSVMNEEGAERYYARVLTYVVLAAVFLALLVSAVAGDGLILKGQRSYWPCAALIPLLALAAVFDTASQVLNVGITLRKRTIYSPVVTGLALAVNVGLNFLLIPKYGAFGASVSTLLSFVAFACLRFYFSNLFFKVRYEWTRALGSIWFGGLILAGFYAIDLFRGSEPARKTIVLSLVIKLVLALSYPAGLFFAGYFSSGELARLAEVIQRIRAGRLSPLGSSAASTIVAPNPARANTDPSSREN